MAGSGDRDRPVRVVGRGARQTRLRTNDAGWGGGFRRRNRYLPGGMPEKLAELAGAAEGPVAAADGWHELAVANPTFLLERLGSECTDLQGLRELTVNGLDAIAALGADRQRPGGVGSGLGAVRRDPVAGCGSCR